MALTLVGVALLIFGGLTTWRVTRGRAGLGGQREFGPYRTGPWPGLSPSGARVLLGCALLLAGGQLVLGDLHRPLPDLPVLAMLAVGPMALATRIVRAPGAASAVCGAYLLPRTFLSLIDPSLEPPPLLLVPALAFDVCAWLQASDLIGLGRIWPGRQSAGRRRRSAASPPSRSTSVGVTRAGFRARVPWLRVPREVRPWVTSGVTPDVKAGVTLGVTPSFYAGGGRRGTVGPRRRAGRRRVGWRRAAVAGAVFGAVLAIVEPPFALVLGADPAAWSYSASGASGNLWLASGLTTIWCALVGLVAASGRGTAA